MVAAIQETPEADAVLHGQNAAQFVRSGAKSPAQAQMEIHFRITISVNGPNAGALPQVGLPKDENPALSRP
jgi:hypothetical protein